MESLLKKMRKVINGEIIKSKPQKTSKTKPKTPMPKLKGYVGTQKKTQLNNKIYVSLPLTKANGKDISLDDLKNIKQWTEDTVDMSQYPNSRIKWHINGLSPIGWRTVYSSHGTSYDGDYWAGRVKDPNKFVRYASVWVGISILL